MNRSPKKILLLASMLLLTGAGCAKIQAPKTNDAMVKEPPKEPTKLDEALLAKQPDNNLNTHYPSFIPDELQIDKDSLSVNDGPRGRKIITYTLGQQTDAESDEPWITVQEQSNSAAELNNYNLAENETALTRLNGYSLESEGRLGKFYQVVFATADNTLIRLTSKQFDLETLIKIAESM